MISSHLKIDLFLLAGSTKTVIWNMSSAEDGTFIWSGAGGKDAAAVYISEDYKGKSEYVFLLWLPNVGLSVCTLVAQMFAS